MRKYGGFIYFILYDLKIKLWQRTDYRVPGPNVQNMPNRLSKYSE